MVGLSDLFWAYQNSGPLLLFALLAGGTYVWKHDLHPRLKVLEETQAERADKWEDQQLNAQERTMLLDDAHDRADQLDEAVDRLKTRVRALEQAYAAEHHDHLTDSHGRPNTKADGSIRSRDQGEGGVD